MDFRRAYLLMVLLGLVFLTQGCGEDASSALGGDGSSRFPASTDVEAGGDADGDADIDIGGGEEGGEEPVVLLPQAGQLTAGEWRDLDHWDFWTGQVSQGGEYAAVLASWNYNTLERIPVVVRNGEKPVVDAQVVLRAGTTVVWEARTNNNGEAELFPGLFGPDQGPFEIEVTSGGLSALADVTTDGGPVEVQLTGTAPARVLDLMFVIDTTGSMTDELTYLQSELTYVVNAVSELSGQELQIRTSINFYRDNGDAYVVRSSPFTTDVEEANSFLSSTGAAGGGDTPEAVDQGMDDAIHQHEWSDSAVSRLLFLVLDAPPHSDNQTMESLQVSVEDAAALGVRIVPVAASGVDQSTEFLLRAMAVATGGTYTFLTDDSGIGNSHLEPTIGEYEVEYLKDLLVRVINESL